MRCDLEPFFDCRFIWSLAELQGPEPYFIFADEQSDVFARELLVTARLGAQLIGFVRSAKELEQTDAPVYMDAPAWGRRHRELIAAGVRGDRARPLLNFDVDPTGYWDFAKSCGPELERVIKNRRLDAPALAALHDYLETWVGTRAIGDRLSSMPSFTVRDYGSLADAHLPEIARVLRVLADDESRAAYTRVLFGDNEALIGHFVEKVFGAQQYMEIVKLKPGDVVVNCGVGRGWEIPYFICMTRGQGRIFNFDPNIVWRSTPYADFIGQFTHMLDERDVIIGSHDGTVDMPISNANMVRSDEVGQVMAAAGVPTERYESRRLDSLADEGVFERIDYLKMDVEGGERDILQGAMGAIRRFRPKLAVAIYHEPQHFWEYPNMLIDQLEGYRYYVRQYGYSRFETLLYAIPEEDIESRSGAEGLRRPTLQPPKAGDGWATAYLRDRTPRDLYYAGGRRLLTRASGPNLSLAALDPVPHIDTDDILAVFELGGATTVLTMHPAGPGGQILIGRFREPSALEWTHAQGLSPTHTCIPAPGPAGEPGYAIFSADERRAWVYAIEESGVTPLMAFDIQGEAPYLLQRTESGVRTLSVEGGGVTLRDYAGSGEAPAIEAVLPLPGRFAGVASVRRERPDSPPEQAIVVEDDGGLVFLDGQGRRIAQWGDHDQFMLTSTFVEGVRPLVLDAPASEAP